MSFSRREGARVKYYEQYVLTYHGKKFDCFLENFSTSGVLITCDQIAEEKIFSGDVCTITISAAPPSDVSCRIARHDRNQLGLEFTAGK